MIAVQVGVKTEYKIYGCAPYKKHQNDVNNGRFHNPTLKTPLIKCAFKVNATLNLK
jgi:hypothetical protein